MKDYKKLVKELNIDDRGSLNYIMLIDYHDSSYGVYYVHIKDNKFIIDNRKVDIDQIYDSTSSCHIVNKLDDDRLSNLLISLLDL